MAGTSPAEAIVINDEAPSLKSSIEKIGSEVYNNDPERYRDAHVTSMDSYRSMYDESVSNPESFWTRIANEFYWKEKWPGKFMEYNFDLDKGPIFVKFMEGGKTNICYNVLDRIVNEKKLGTKTAFFWAGNETSDEMSITYEELLKQVCKFANVLKSKGVKKGDRVAIYMPMIVELVVAMLACARIGAVHSIVGLKRVGTINFRHNFWAYKHDPEYLNILTVTNLEDDCIDDLL